MSHPSQFPDVPDVVRRRMSLVRKTDTKPEMLVRRLAHSLGYRFRLHRRDLPGTPDITFPRFKKVIFVHGCFWHRHDCRLGARLPATRPEYWLPKLARNVERDQIAEAELARLGWSVFVIWECETRNAAALQGRLRSWLDPTDRARQADAAGARWCEGVHHGEGVAAEAVHSLDRSGRL